MVLIPAGEFVMGSAREGERPQRRIHLEACLIDKHEVTVAQFRKFVQETGYVTEAERSGGARVAPNWYILRPDANWKNPGFKQADEHPVVCVSWNDAVAYCEWAGKRLPSEAEWEKAARGTEGRIWPWGFVWKEGRANAVPATAGTRPVGSFPAGASPWGLLDMAGNVSEWCADRYGPYAEGRAAGPETGEKRVLRGGSFVDAEQVLIRGARRHQQPPTFRSSPDGFRGARGIE